MTEEIKKKAEEVAVLITKQGNHPSFVCVMDDRDSAFLTNMDSAAFKKMFIGLFKTRPALIQVAADAVRVSAMRDTAHQALLMHGATGGHVH